MNISSSVNMTDVNGRTSEIALGKKFIIIRKVGFPVMIDSFRMKGNTLLYITIPKKMINLDLLHLLYQW